MRAQFFYFSDRARPLPERVDTARRAGSSKAIVHTAAASQLGQMLNRLAMAEGMDIINVVRRAEQREALEGLGAKHVIVTDDGQDDDPTAWKAELRAKVRDLGATCAFDAVSGDMTGHLLDCMPGRGIVYAYGVLAGKANGIDPLDLIYRRKELRGFLLTAWLREGGPMRMIPRMLTASSTVNSGLKVGGWCRSQFTDTTMEGAHAEIVKLLGSSITGKKLRIRFDGK
jgi:NADPH:quinone reductase-like Zn-dependent oxidoreductase